MLHVGGYVCEFLSWKDLGRNLIWLNPLAHLWISVTWQVGQHLGTPAAIPLIVGLLRDQYIYPLPLSFWNVEPMKR